MITTRKFFMVLVTVAVMAVYLTMPRDAFSRMDTNVNPDITAEQMKAFVVEDFEDPGKVGNEDGWRITTTPQQLKDASKQDKNPVPILEQKIISGRPGDMRPDEWAHNKLGIKNNEVDRVKSVYGVRFKFRYPGYNSVHIEPPVNPELTPSGETKKVRGIKLPGKARALSMWVHSRGHPYSLECWVEDYQNRVHILKMGKANFVGWRPLKAYIPVTIPQEVDTFPQTKFIRVVRFVLRADPGATALDDVYVFFDQLKLLTDDYEANFDGQELDKLFKGESGKSSAK
jgi:hypothetical protein